MQTSFTRLCTCAAGHGIEYIWLCALPPPTWSFFAKCLTLIFRYLSFFFLSGFVDTLFKTFVSQVFSLLCCCCSPHILTSTLSASSLCLVLCGLASGPCTLLSIRCCQPVQVIQRATPYNSAPCPAATGLHNRLSPRPSAIAC